MKENIERFNRKIEKKQKIRIKMNNQKNENQNQIKKTNEIKC